MSTTLGTAARNASVDAVTALVNGGSGDASGDIVLATGSDVACATLVFSNPAFAASSGGTGTANAITSDTNAVGGTATRAIIRNRANAEIFRCNVGITGSDINLSSNVIPAGGTVQITSLTYTQPAGSTT